MSSSIVVVLACVLWVSLTLSSSLSLLSSGHLGVGGLLIWTLILESLSYLVCESWAFCRGCWSQTHVFSEWMPSVGFWSVSGVVFRRLSVLRSQCPGPERFFRAWNCRFWIPGGHRVWKQNMFIKSFCAQISTALSAQNFWTSERLLPSQNWHCLPAVHPRRWPERTPEQGISKDNLRVNTPANRERERERCICI